MPDLSELSDIDLAERLERASAELVAATQEASRRNVSAPDLRQYQLALEVFRPIAEEYRRRDS